MQHWWYLQIELTGHFRLDACKQMKMMKDKIQINKDCHVFILITTYGISISTDEKPYHTVITVASTSLALV